jgi:hypothetical protein
MTIYSDKLPSTLAQAAHDVRDWLRRSPAVRGGLYFGGAVLILNRASACFPDDSQESLLAIHLTTFPFGAALTTVMQQIEGRPVRIQFTTEDLDHLMQGAALGASAFGILTAIGLAKGWLRAPAWGWEHASLSGVLTSIAKHSGGLGLERRDRFSRVRLCRATGGDWPTSGDCGAYPAVCPGPSWNTAGLARSSGGWDGADRVAPQLKQPVGTDWLSLGLERRANRLPRPTRWHALAAPVDHDWPRALGWAARPSGAGGIVGARTGRDGSDHCGRWLVPQAAAEAVA